MIGNPNAPQVTDHYIDLPLTKLHYVKSGSGPPLIMVPATISRLEHWVELAQFMGTVFNTHFFELPGHGKSSPFEADFSSELVAETIENFIDELGFSKITLMGFSFGGVLAIKALQRLQDRVERVVLISPSVSKHALTYSWLRKWLMAQTSVLLKKPAIQEKFISILHNPKFERRLIAAIKALSRAEDNVPMNKSFHKMPRATLDVLAYQLGEVMNLEHPPLAQRFSQPLHFAMSVNDPLLDFTTTHNFLDSYFSDITSVVLTYPYHQPPEHPTFEALQKDFSKFLEAISPKD